MKRVFEIIRQYTLWLLFIGSCLFFLLGWYCFSEADKESEFGLNGDKPSAYVRDHAAARAMAKLVQYAEKNRIPVYQFKGPYFHESLGLDFSTYSVCYKHSRYYFCYDDWTNYLEAFPLKNNTTEPSLNEWLKAQPD